MEFNIKIKAVVLAALCVIIMSFFSACDALDVVGKDSIRSFGDLLQALPAEDAGDTWSLTAPDEAAGFFWNGETAFIEVNALPFIDAGLDSSRLPSFADDKLVFRVNFPGTGQGKSEPLEDYRQIVKTGRSSMNYHAAMDHFGVMLGGGNMFEWSKNLVVNTIDGDVQEKDMVFVLNPEPLIGAGVDPARVEGWVYTQVPVEQNGKMIDVYKFLKPFNLA
ncbi:MAG: hypothetical protein LBT44_06350 [Clostridiales bacterium]|jgi:hypothetical protein|nr:hypothetical protein [Clostridiales bacterium]